MHPSVHAKAIVAKRKTMNNPKKAAALALSLPSSSPPAFTTTMSVGDGVGVGIVGLRVGAIVGFGAAAVSTRTLSTLGMPYVLTMSDPRTLDGESSDCANVLALATSLAPPR
mmetsp:Transcript_15420/g.29086  ORF Transcript_15420/g.29086 Transcript_15420/m.29086 type:complete len:112 (+) Transcript_15420:701-1036(+)